MSCNDFCMLPDISIYVLFACWGKNRRGTIIATVLFFSKIVVKPL